MSETEAIPLKISYTDEDVANAAKRDRFAKGTYRGVVSDITRQVSKDAGHLMFKVVYRALKDPNDAGSVFGPGLYHYQCLPFRNPNRDDHVPQKFFARATNNWLAAHIPEKVPLLPARINNQLWWKGEVIEPSDEESAKKEAYDASFEFASGMWEDESNEQLEAFKGQAVYFDVDYTEGREFPSLNNFRGELGEGEELVDPAIALTAEIADMPTEVEGTKAKTNGKHANGKNGKVAAKPVAKPAVKFAGKRK